MRVFRSVSLVCTSVTLFVATARLALASDAAVRSTLGQTAGSSGFRNICASGSCVSTVVGAVINILLGLMGVGLIGYILYAGFLWMTSGGEDKQVESARTIIRNAVIGIFIMGASYTLASTGLRLVADTFTASPPEPLVEEEAAPGAPAGTAPGTLRIPGARTPTAPSGIPTDPYATGCTWASCVPACTSQECSALSGQRRFTCERLCQTRCNLRCASSDAGLPGPGPARTELSIPERCRNPAGFRACHETCIIAAEDRTASVTPPSARELRFADELRRCDEVCQRGSCSYR